jgi:hypothetical protein
VTSEIVFWVFFSCVVLLMATTALVTALRKRWRLFALGFLTGGIAWLGALKSR